MPLIYNRTVTPHHQLFSDVLILAKLRLEQGKSKDAMLLCRYAVLAAPDLYPQAMPFLKQAALDCADMGAVAAVLASLPEKAPLTDVPERPWPLNPVLNLQGMETLRTELAGVLPRISVITVCYNSARYIEETILSVLNQGYPNVEHILIDGGSTDGTMAIVERYKDHFARIVSEPDQGQADAITKGFRLASGELATWLNSDDLFMPGALMAMATRFAETGAEVVAGIIEAFGEEMESKWHFSPYEKGRLDLADITDIDGQWLQSTFFYQPEVMYTLDLWRRAGGFIDNDIFYCVDWDLWARFAALKARFAKTARPIARYRVHKDQKTFLPESYLPELRELARLYGRDICIVSGPEGIFFLPGDAANRWRDILEGRKDALITATSFASRHVVAGSCVVDIGSGPGLLTVRLAGMVGATGRILAFEGNEHTHFLLKRTLASHGLGQVAAMLGFPVPSGGGMLRFEAAAGDGENALGFARSHREGRAIPTVGLDAQMFGDRKLALVHLDAAGLEPLALRELRDLLVKHRPALLVKADPERLALFGQDRHGLIGLLTALGCDVAPPDEECYIQAIFREE